MLKIHPLLSKERQALARRYEKEKRLLGLGSSLWLLLILLAFYFSRLSLKLAFVFKEKSIIWTFLFYMFIFLLALTLLGFPLKFYSSYLHEHRWQFSNQTFKSWLWDQIKSFLVGLVILWLIAGLLLWIMAKFPGYWWLIAGLAMAMVSVILATLFPVVIFPIFNKYTPIEDKQLTKALEDILAKGGLKSSGFYKEDSSRQTKKENAFLAGLGKTRRVVLADNLLEKMTIPEIESIIAHEVGHFRYKHLWLNIGLGTCQQLVIFFIIDNLMKFVFPQFLSSPNWNLNLFPILVIAVGIISGFIFGPISNALSRLFEKQADIYALMMIQDKRPFMTALAGLADRNLSNAYPKWWIKILYYSHPPIGERLKIAEEFKKGPKNEII